MCKCDPFPWTYPSGPLRVVLKDIVKSFPPKWERFFFFQFDLYNTNHAYVNIKYSQAFHNNMGLLFVPEGRQLEPLQGSAANSHRRISVVSLGLSKLNNKRTIEDLGGGERIEPC